MGFRAVVYRHPEGTCPGSVEGDAKAGRLRWRHVPGSFKEPQENQGSWTTVMTDRQTDDARAASSQTLGRRPLWR